ncbi:hypothetical protein [Algibacter mikhailovii]|nr:hypothetical protein [Algibacter mikhailovii]
MMMILDYLIYRVFGYFDKKNPSKAKSNTINFISIFEGTVLVPIFLIFNGITKIYSTPENPNPSMKYYIGIPLAILLLILNTKYIKIKLKNNGIDLLNSRFKNTLNWIPIWLIFSSPIIFVFVCPIIYGAINGTLSFPLFEK